MTSIAAAAENLQNFTQKRREDELNSTLVPNELVRFSEIQKQEDKKAAFLAQNLEFVILDSYTAQLVPGCRFRISRKKLNWKAILVAISRSPLPNFEVDYVMDNSGNTIPFEDLRAQGRTPPVYYILVEKVRRSAFDIRTDARYQGQTVMMVDNVPLKTRSAKYLVDSSSLKEWVLFAIIEEDPQLRLILDAVEKAKEEIAEIDKKVLALRHMKFFEPNGKLMSEAKATAQRTILTETYTDDRKEAVSFVKKKEEVFRELSLWRRAMEVNIEQAEVDENAATASYNVSLGGVHDALNMEDLLVRKDDWSGIKLAVGDSNAKLPPWAGRGPMPDGTRGRPDYRQLEVSIWGARIKRVPHGVGTWRSLDTKGKNISSGQFSFFYGDWEGAKRTGHGISIDDTGVYAGRYIEDYRDGYARMDYADGTTIIGTFGHAALHPESGKGEMFRNPYVEGLPHGKDIEVLFADGGLYVGEMKSGRITGTGKYQSAFNEAMAGSFVDGVLQGNNEFYMNYAGESFSGTFVNGELHGEGVYKNKRADSYKGSFRHNFRHGRGVLEGAGGKYIGYFCNGLFAGKGLLECGTRTTKKATDSIKAATNSLEKSLAKLPLSQPKEKSVVTKEPMERETPAESGSGLSGSREEEPPVTSKFSSTFMGYFIGHSYMNGGAVMDSVVQAPFCLSRKSQRALAPLTALESHSRKTEKKIARKIEKYTDMEHFVRGEIAERKRKIFRQQRHEVKKAMAEDADLGLTAGSLKQRRVARDYRLKYVNMEKAVPTKSLVPRLELLSHSNPENHLLQYFRSIKPDGENGTVTDVSRRLAKVVLSDFEEGQERNRFIQYDKYFDRAEEAFVKRKQEALEKKAAAEQL